MTFSPATLAAVDLGSNSFRLIVGRVDETAAGRQIHAVDVLREPVRLGAGLDAERFLDSASQERALATLARFGERLRGFDSRAVRAVATNTLRVAKNAALFLAKAEETLGYPIEVIGGREEARLIYAGAAHTVAPIEGRRLVIDIGGGSTEFIIGQNYEPLLLESLYIGCVSHSRTYFRDGVIGASAMTDAILEARLHIESIAGEYRRRGWQQVIGSSGTARALADLIEANAFNLEGVAYGITRAGLERLKRALLKAGHLDRVKLHGLKADRAPVLAGGLSIMIAAFEELGVDYAETTDGALRLGVLYDMVGRSHQQDMRAVTVERFMSRYAVDRAQAERVARCALALYRQLPVDDARREGDERILQWAGALHEIGLSISHNGYHKHSSYILENADMPGFSKTEQVRLAALQLGLGGKLSKTAALPATDLRLLFCLRFAVLLCRRRVDVEPLQVGADKAGYWISVAREWADGNPLADYQLTQEAAEWVKAGRTVRRVWRPGAGPAGAPAIAPDPA